MRIQVKFLQISGSRLSTPGGIPIPPKTGRMAQSLKAPLQNGGKLFVIKKTTKQKTYIISPKPRVEKVRED